MTPLPENPSATLRANNPHLFGPVLTARTSEPVQMSAHDIKCERELQKLCEGQLEQWGYLRMSKGTAGRATVGYFYHLNDARNNHLLPDLMIFDLRGNCLLVELKTERTATRYQPGQREMIEQGFWVQANTFEEFCLLVMEWRRENNHGIEPPK